VRVSIERERKDRSSWFSKKPPLFLVHVQIDLSREEFEIFRAQGVAAEEVYKDWTPDTDQYLPVILGALIINKPHTLTFPNGAEAIAFENHLKEKILPRLKSYLQARPTNTGPEVFEM